MFDRIAGVYDLMNSAMTAGLHHQWRERAVDRARGRPGLRRPRRLLRHRRPGAGAAPADRPRWPRRRLRLLRADARARPPQERRGGARRSSSAGRTRSTCPTATTSFDAVTIGFGARNLADLDRGPGRDGPGPAARRPAGDPRDHPAAARAAGELLLALVRPRRPGDRHVRRRLRRLQLPARVGPQLPRARAPRGDDRRRRLRPRSAGCCWPGGIIAIHSATKPA